MNITLDWLGTATFRLTVGDTVLFLDAYMDRVPSAPPVGLRAAEVTRADFVLVGHSHFDHLAGAEVIARNTGAKVIGSTETARVLRDHDVPKGQLVVCHGGERHRLADGVTVRVFPSLHACTWWFERQGAGEAVTGHSGLTEDERAATYGLGHEIRALGASGDERASEMIEHVRRATGSFDHGGPLVYLIETPAGSIFYQDTSGCWTGVLRELRADVAILAASGRANVDGEPIQGSLAQFVSMEASLLGARTVVLGHHDDWMPPLTAGGLDIAPIRDELSRSAPGVNFIAPSYVASTRLLASL